MTNLADMMKQAQMLQARMSEMQERLADVEITGAAPRQVQVTLSGKVEARKVKIDPSLAAPEDVEVLEDLIVAAFNDARPRSRPRWRKRCPNSPAACPCLRG